jgi:hypothetical protein
VALIAIMVLHGPDVGRHIPLGDDGGFWAWVKMLRGAPPDYLDMWSALGTRNAALPASYSTSYVLTSVAVGGGLAALALGWGMCICASQWGVACRHRRRRRMERWHSSKLKGDIPWSEACCDPLHGGCAARIAAGQPASLLVSRQRRLALRLWLLSSTALLSAMIMVGVAAGRAHAEAAGTHDLFAEIVHEAEERAGAAASTSASVRSSQARAYAVLSAQLGASVDGALRTANRSALDALMAAQAEMSAVSSAHCPWCASVRTQLHAAAAALAFEAAVAVEAFGDAQASAASELATALSPALVVAPLEGAAERLGQMAAAARSTLEHNWWDVGGPFDSDLYRLLAIIFVALFVPMQVLFGLQSAGMLPYAPDAVDADETANAERLDAEAKHAEKANRTAVDLEAEDFSTDEEDSGDTTVVPAGAAPSGASGVGLQASLPSGVPKASATGTALYAVGFAGAALNAGAASGAASLGNRASAAAATAQRAAAGGVGSIATSAQVVGATGLSHVPHWRLLRQCHSQLRLHCALVFAALSFGLGGLCLIAAMPLTDSCELSKQVATPGFAVAVADGTAHATANATANATATAIAIANATANAIANASANAPNATSRRKLSISPSISRRELASSAWSVDLPELLSGCLQPTTPSAWMQALPNLGGTEAQVAALQSALQLTNSAHADRVAAAARASDDASALRSSCCDNTLSKLEQARRMVPQEPPPAPPRSPPSPLTPPPSPP